MCSGFVHIRQSEAVMKSEQSIIIVEILFKLSHIWIIFFFSIISSNVSSCFAISCWWWYCWCHGAIAVVFLIIIIVNAFLLLLLLLIASFRIDIWKYFCFILLLLFINILFTCAVFSLSSFSYFSKLVLKYTFFQYKSNLLCSHYGFGLFWKIFNFESEIVCVCVWLASDIH